MVPDLTQPEEDDSAIFVGCGTETSGGGRVRKDFIKFIYKSD